METSHPSCPCYGGGLLSHGHLKQRLRLILSYEPKSRRDHLQWWLASSETRCRNDHRGKCAYRWRKLLAEGWRFSHRLHHSKRHQQRQREILTMQRRPRRKERSRCRLLQPNQHESQLGSDCGEISRYKPRQTLPMRRKNFREYPGSDQWAWSSWKTHAGWRSASNVGHPEHFYNLQHVRPRGTMRSSKSAEIQIYLRRYHLSNPWIKIKRPRF